MLVFVHRSSQSDHDVAAFSEGEVNTGSRRRLRFPVDDMLCRDCDDPGLESEWK